MTNRDQHIKVMLGPIVKNRFYLAACAVTAYDALLESLTPLQRLVLEGDERYAVVEVELLESFVDPFRCDWDHNHNCQAHDYFYIAQGEKCPQQELKDVLSAIPQDQNDET